MLQQNAKKKAFQFDHNASQMIINHKNKNKFVNNIINVQLSVAQCALFLLYTILILIVRLAICY